MLEEDWSPIQAVTNGGFVKWIEGDAGHPTSLIGMRKLVVKDTDRDERIHPRTAGGQRAAELRAEM